MRPSIRWLLVAVALGAARVAVAQNAQQQGSVASKPALPAGYAGSKSCNECHKEVAAPFAETNKGALLLSHPRDKHEALGCETCHGPSKTHAQTGAEERGDMIIFSRKSKTSVAERNAVCLSCHAKTARTLWKGSAHESHDVACTDCHSVMHENSERANLKKETVTQTCGRCHSKQQSQQLRFAHMPLGEQKIECTSCHNPHGSAGPTLLNASSINETCFSCHAEKRGPFLYQHPPVQENCANCHDPHGSSHEKMLKVSRPRLCQQCHAGANYHPTQPRTATLTADVPFVLNRQCQNCHFNIHGSNHPSGKAFTR